jgi:glutamate carboxypeptidase
VTTTALDLLTSRLDRMVSDLDALVRVESPTDDVAATTEAAEVAAQLGGDLLGADAERITAGGRIHLRWRFGAGDRVLLLGHLDTVWPVGTLARWPLRVEDGIAYGPGTFDMKAGVVQLLHALSALDDLDGVTVLLTTDEETGSPTSRALIEETARGAAAALVLEGAADSAVKTQRKGVSMYELRVQGRAAHAGVEPEKGVNASVELAHQILAVTGVADSAAGTSVTPTRMRAGTTGNTVPAEATLFVDVRAFTSAEQQRVDDELHALRPVLPGAELVLTGGPNRPPLERRMAADLYERACSIATRIGLEPLAEIAVGGGSDGNFTAGVGVPTLDGLGAVGGGAHAEGEHIVVDEMARRGALVSELVAELTR